jgi:hypothetical protein
MRLTGSQGDSMRVKSVERLHAEKIRRDKGFSYSEICKITGINKSTLSL